MPAKKPSPGFPVRFTPDDLKLIARLQKKTGAVSRADIIRRALRALAENEGLK